MNIILIQPPTENIIANFAPEEFEAQKFGRMPPLGLLSIASYLKANAQNGHSIKVLDCISDAVDYAQLKKYLWENKPDVAGISVNTFTLIDALKTARLVKSLDSNIKTVMGGYHINIFPDETLVHDEVDFVILGEGEICFSALIEKLNNNKDDFSGFKGFGYKHNGNLVIERTINIVDDLDSLPLLDRTMVNYKKHSNLLGEKGLGTLISTSRGCPYNCTFCFQPIKKVRFRSIENIIAEIENCLSLGIHDVYFTDDLFNQTAERVLAFSNEVIRRKLKFTWSFRGRMNKKCLTEEALRKAKEAGCIKINFGVESINDETLKRINKNITTSDIEEAITISSKAGIEKAVNIIIGLPGQNKKELLENSNYLCSKKIDYIEVSILVPFPNTAIFQQAVEKGIIDKDLWRNFALHPTKGFQTPYYEENFTREELIYYSRLFYRKFYFRPGYIVKRVLKIKGFKELLDSLIAGMMVFKVVIKQYRKPPTAG